MLLDVSVLSKKFFKKKNTINIQFELDGYM